MSVPVLVGPTTAPCDALSDAIHRDGIAGLPGLFPREWAEALREDFVAAFAHARSYDGGTISRGPNRYYFTVHPQQIRGFVDLVTAPAVTQLCGLLLGRDYKIVELGFDVPLPGAINQPWHRDFPAPPEGDGAYLTSLAFNVTTVDVEPDMGPFEIAPGTHWDNGDDFAHRMFPQRPEQLRRYDSLGSLRFPRQGDVSVRSGLAIHRGTANVSDRERAVLILGVTTRDTNTDVHELNVTQPYFDALPAAARRHLECTVVDELRPIIQRHDIEGLMMGG